MVRLNRDGSLTIHYDDGERKRPIIGDEIWCFDDSAKNAVAYSGQIMTELSCIEVQIRDIFPYFFKSILKYSVNKFFMKYQAQGCEQLSSAKLTRMKRDLFSRT